MAFIRLCIHGSRGSVQVYVKLMTMFVYIIAVFFSLGKSESVVNYISVQPLEVNLLAG